MILKNGLVRVSVENPIVPLLLLSVGAFSVDVPELAVLEFVVAPLVDASPSEQPVNEASNKTAIEP